MENQNNPAQNAATEAVAQETKKVDKKTIIGIAIAVAVAIVVILVVWLLNSNASHKADEAIALADLEQNDSIALARYMDAAKLGHDSGNRAALEAAIRLYKKGEYEQAIKYLDDASVSSEVAEAGKYCLMGDCYVNLNNYDKALSCYDKAISASDGNPQIIPFVMVKKANIYTAQGNYDKAYETYDKIYKEYPEYTNNLGIDIRKFAERARVAAGK